MSRRARLALSPRAPTARSPTRWPAGVPGGKGAKIGAILGVIAAIPTGGLSLLGGVVAGSAGGGVLGHFVHHNYSLSEADLARIHGGLDEGKAFIGVLVPAEQAGAFEMQLTRFGGVTKSHDITEEGAQKAEAAVEAAPPASEDATSAPSSNTEPDKE